MFPVVKPEHSSIKHLVHHKWKIQPKIFVFKMHGGILNYNDNLHRTITKIATTGWQKLSIHVVNLVLFSLIYMHSELGSSLLLIIIHKPKIVNAVYLFLLFKIWFLRKRNNHNHDKQVDCTLPVSTWRRSLSYPLTLDCLRHIQLLVFEIEWC